MSRSTWFLSFFLCHSVFVQATEKVSTLPEPSWLVPYPIDPNRQPGSKEINNGYYYELREEQINLENNTRYTHIIKQIVNESGVQNGSEVSVTFSPYFQQVIFHKIAVIRNGVVINQLHVNQIRVVQEETDATDFQYNGLKRAFLLLKDIRQGDKIDVSYSVIGFNPVFGSKYTNKILFADDVGISNYFQIIILPAGRKLFFQSFNHADLPIEKKQGNLLIYSWINPIHIIYPSEPGTPTWFTISPYVSISEYNGWQEVVDWGLNIFKNYRYSPSVAMNHKMDEWRKIARDDKDLYALMAIRFVQDEIRYQGLEMGEYTHRPHEPSEVFEHRYGDCKDKALLLTILLQQEHIEAYVAFVNTERREKLYNDSPSSSEFDHALVAIKRSREYIFIDPTISLQRGELVDLFVPAYGYALIFQPGEHQLQQVEPGFLNLSTIEETIELSSGDSAIMDINREYKGGMADDYRNYCSDLSQQQLDKNLLEYYEKIFIGIQLSSSAEIIDDSLKNTFSIAEHYKIPNVWHSNSEGKSYVDIYAKQIYSMIPDPTGVMKNAPMGIEFPKDIHLNLHIRMPTSSSLDLDNVHIHNEFYQFDFTQLAHGSMIQLSYHFKTLKDFIPVEALIQYSNDYKKIDNVTGIRLYKNIHLDNQALRGINPGNTNTLNWGMAIFALFVLGLSGFILYSVNKREAYVLYDPASAWPLGGWTIVLGITIGVTAIFFGINLFSGYYFSEPVWNNLKETSTVLPYVFALEMLIKLVCFSLCLGCAYWFIGRRDIFPLMFLWYVGSIIAGNLILSVLYGVVPLPRQVKGVQSSLLLQVLRSIIYAAIWVTYILRSERVKSTFLLPFKGNLR